MHFSIILTWLTSTMLLLYSSAATAIPAPNELLTRGNTNTTNIEPFPFDPINTPYLASAFDVIVSIPDNIIAQGETVVKQWIKDHTPSQPPSSRDLHSRQNWWNIANCVWTVLQVL